MDELKDEAVRLLLLAISGAGAMTFIAGALAERVADEFNSGEGGGDRHRGQSWSGERRAQPSAGGGPASALNASRFATAESE